VLGRRVRDLIRVVRTPPGGFTLTRDCHIAGVTTQRRAGSGRWDTRFDLWSATFYQTYATSRWDVATWDNRAGSSRRHHRLRGRPPDRPDGHPTVPEGFRWAVMLGPCGPGDMSRCANAGWCPTRDEATAEGDQNGATTTRVLRVAGHNVRYGEATQVLQLDFDPITPGNDPTVRSLTGGS
jgi:hypothetical protein